MQKKGFSVLSVSCVIVLLIVYMKERVNSRDMVIQRGIRGKIFKRIIISLWLIMETEFRTGCKKNFYVLNT